jgi:glycerophosphoryl diester phosphodiesterase
MHQPPDAQAVTAGSPPAGRIERVAHRGCPRERVENTVPSLRLAVERGADTIELDAHVSSDGEVVVHHDDVVQGVVIARATWSTLSAIDLGGGARIPTLADALDAVGNEALVYIELKGRDIERDVLTVARRHGRRYAMHSFDLAAVERIARTAPEVTRGMLIERDTPDPVGVLHAWTGRIRPRDVWPHHSLVDAHFMTAARALGLRVVPWTVNDRAMAERFAALGVAGMCTDELTVLANL